MKFMASAAFAGAIAAMAACASAEPAATGRGRARAAPQQDVLISEEALNSIRTTFDHQRTRVSRCYAAAVDAGDLPANQRGYVTVMLAITPAGEATRVRVGEASFDSEVLRGCVVRYVERLAFPTLPKPLDYSYTFAFEPL